MMPTPRTVEERFWPKVDQSGGLFGCWEWTGAKAGWGYGQIKINGKHAGAHRVIYEWMHGPIPKGLCVLHHCDNPPCVNPAHLWLGTHADNALDSCAKGRRAKGESHSSAKLTEKDVHEIRLDKRLLRIVALAYGVSPGTIGDIRKRRIWRALA